MIKTPYNLETTIDDNNLRDVASDPIQMEKGVHFLITKAQKSEDLRYKAQGLSQAGAHARIINNYKQSRELLFEAQSIYESLEMKTNSLLVDVRLGVLSQWEGHYDVAINIYEKIMSDLNKSNNNKINPLKSFSLFHYAKCRFEQKRYEAAIELFSECHVLRLTQGDLHLIEMTQHCMVLTQRKIDQRPSREN